jgi:hypothetical protein
MTTEENAAQLANTLSTPPPFRFKFVSNKLSILKNNFNKKYVGIIIIIVIFIVVMVLYGQHKKNKALFTNISFLKKNTHNKKNKPTLNDEDEDDDEELTPQVNPRKPSKPSNYNNLRQSTKPAKSSNPAKSYNPAKSAQEPKHIKELDLTNDEMKIIEDELNNQSGGEDNLSDNNNE